MTHTRKDGSAPRGTQGPCRSTLVATATDCRDHSNAAGGLVHLSLCIVAGGGRNASLRFGQGTHKGCRRAVVERANTARRVLSAGLVASAGVRLSLCSGGRILSHLLPTRRAQNAPAYKVKPGTPLFPGGGKPGAQRQENMRKYSQSGRAWLPRKTQENRVGKLRLNREDAICAM